MKKTTKGKNPITKRMGQTKGQQVSVRFEENQLQMLRDLSGQTGIPVADIIRRGTIEYITNTLEAGEITLKIRRPVEGVHIAPRD